MIAAPRFVLPGRDASHRRPARRSIVAVRVRLGLRRSAPRTLATLVRDDANPGIAGQHFTGSLELYHQERKRDQLCALNTHCRRFLPWQQCCSLDVWTTALRQRTRATTTAQRRRQGSTPTPWRCCPPTSRMPASSSSASTRPTRRTSTRTTPATRSAGTSSSPTRWPPSWASTTEYQAVKLRQDHPEHHRRHLRHRRCPPSPTTSEREKAVDFVNYYTAGIQWAQPIGQDRRPGQRLRPEGGRAGDHLRGDRRAAGQVARRAPTPARRRSRS